MKKLIELLRDGCWHSWEIHSEAPCRRTKKDDFGALILDKTGILIITRCKHCGTMKTQTFYPE